jgi:uracil-DNA glycosylase family 4
MMGNGDPNNRILIVGEAPGANEDELGQPFVGKAGQVLNNALNQAGIARSEVYVTNIAKCRPPGNRKPTEEEAFTCVTNYLIPEYRILKPRFVLILGNTALHTITNLTGGISQHRGYIPPHASTMADSDVYATYHPSATFYSKSIREVFEKDITVFAKIINSMYTPSSNPSDVNSTVENLRDIEGAGQNARL